MEVSLQAKAVAIIAREPNNPPPHTNAAAAIGPPSASITADTAKAPPARRPAKKDARKTAERGHMEKRGCVYYFQRLWASFPTLSRPSSITTKPTISIAMPNKLNTAPKLKE